MSNRVIEVTYDGCSPCLCMGTLTIIEDGELIYCAEYCCHSTGSIAVNKDIDFYARKGKLYWNLEDADKFDDEIQQKVAECLSNYHPCCGGCI
jgi:hypothetical protein